MAKTHYLLTIDDDESKVMRLKPGHAVLIIKYGGVEYPIGGDCLRFEVKQSDLDRAIDDVLDV